MPNALITRRLTGAVAFIPPQRPALQAWFDAAVGTYTDTARTVAAAADADPVGGWTDLSGKGNNASQATGGLRPVLKLAQLNGKPSVLFTAASSQYLSADGAGASFAGTNIPFTGVAMMRYVTNTGQFAFTIASTVSANPRGQLQQSSAPTNTLALKNDAAATTLSISGTNPGTVAHAITWMFDGTNGSIFQDGATVAGPTAATSATYTYNNLTLGGAVSTAPVAGVYLNAHVLEFMIWNAALTSGERSYVHAYLGKKYAVAVV